MEEMVRLLLASAGLAGWEETRMVENLGRKMKAERVGAERDHLSRVEAEKAAGVERKKLARRDEQSKRAKEVRKSQAEAARVLSEQCAAAKVAL